MRHQRVGEIGCYLKLSLLRALSAGYRLGIAWYLVPDSARPVHGLQTGYLDLPGRWRNLDPEVFGALHALVHGNQRSLSALERSKIVSAVNSSNLLDYGRVHWLQRVSCRTTWFHGVLADLRDYNLVFADSEMGLVDTGKPLRPDHALLISMQEAKALAENRTAIIFHRNSLRVGGQNEEAEYWLSQFGANTIALRAEAYHPRTFFILNPTPTIRQRTLRFCARWQDLNVNLQGAPPLKLIA